MSARMVRTIAATALAAAAALTGTGLAQGDATVAAQPVKDIRVSAQATTLSVATYNDTRRLQQWAMNRMSGEQLRARRHATGVIVAVIDSGVQANHPDLIGHIVPGWDFTTNTPGGMTDGYGHGTHVAGIIAASANNRMGVAGIAPDAKIMPLRVLDNNGAGWGSSVAKALRFAADHGAKVASLSLASAYSPAIADAVKYAQSKGVIIVAAAGNERQSGNPTSYPAALPGVIGVAAEDSYGRVASFSNTGSYIDVTAPGVTVLSTYKGSTYAYMTGTSMATPYVAGTVATLVAAKPGITTYQTIKALQVTARDMYTRGIDTVSGAGELQPVKAVCAVQYCS